MARKKSLNCFSENGNSVPSAVLPAGNRMSEFLSAVACCQRDVYREVNGEKLHNCNSKV